MSGFRPNDRVRAVVAIPFFGRDLGAERAVLTVVEQVNTADGPTQSPLYRCRLDELSTSLLIFGNELELVSREVVA